MARITVEDCLEKIPSRFDLILMASKRARQLSTTSRDPLVEWDNDKPTLVALREIEEGLIDQETLEKTLEEDLLLDEFSVPNNQEKEKLKDIFSKHTRDVSDLNYVLSLIKRYNVIKACYQKAQHYINLASSSLSLFNDSEEKNILENLTSFSLSRNF